MSYIYEESLRIATCTLPADRPRAEAAILDIYKRLLQSPPEFVWCDSPHDLVEKVYEYVQRVGAIRWSIDCMVPSIEVLMLGEIPIWRDDLGLPKPTDSIKLALLNEYNYETIVVALSQSSIFFAQHEYGWLSEHQDWLWEPCESGNTLVQCFREIARSASWWIPFKGICFVSERPVRYALDEQNRIHHDSLAAIEFRDGWKLWFLHGVNVPEWLVSTPPAEIDPARIHFIENAQVRAEFVRRIGIERILHSLSRKMIDRKTFYTADGREHTYELHRLLVSKVGEEWTYLKMHNPSVDLVHVEGVPNDCTTVEEALMFRAGFTSDQIDNVNGAEWYQQGDVILLPEGAKKFRLFPSQLT